MIQQLSTLLKLLLLCDASLDAGQLVAGLLELVF